MFIQSVALNEATTKPAVTQAHCEVVAQSFNGTNIDVGHIHFPISPLPFRDL